MQENESHWPQFLDDQVLRSRLKESGALVVSLYSGVCRCTCCMWRGGWRVYGHRSPWDACALDVIIHEAGGRMTDLEGKRIDYRAPFNGFIASSSHLYDPLRGFVKLAFHPMRPDPPQRN